MSSYNHVEVQFRTHQNLFGMVTNEVDCWAHTPILSFCLACYLMSDYFTQFPFIVTANQDRKDFSLLRLYDKLELDEYFHFGTLHGEEEGKGMLQFVCDI